MVLIINGVTLSPFLTADQAKAVIEGVQTVAKKLPSPKGCGCRERKEHTVRAIQSALQSLTKADNG